VHESPTGSGHILSLLEGTPPSLRVALGTTTKLPPTPRSFAENGYFLSILRRVVRAHAAADPRVQSDALQFASHAGVPLLNDQRRRVRQGGSGATNYQGGAGGGGVGGWVHVHDQRAVPAYGRIPYPEDILGSLLVDGDGKIVNAEHGGDWEENKMYRLVTSAGVMRLTPFLRDRMREALLEEAERDG